MLQFVIFERVAKHGRMAPKKRKTLNDDMKICVFHDFTHEGLTAEELLVKYNIDNVSIVERAIDEMLESQDTHGKLHSLRFKYHILSNGNHISESADRVLRRREPEAPVPGSLPAEERNTTFGDIYGQLKRKSNKKPAGSKPPPKKKKSNGTLPASLVY